MKKYVLKNGLTLYLYPLNDLHSVSISLCVNSGSASESTDKKGITHLLEHMHFRRLDDMKQCELYKAMDKIGATLRASTYKECMRFKIKVRPVFFKQAISLFRKVITTYNWDEDDLENEKKVVCNEIASKEAYVYTEAIMDSIVWRGHPLAMPICGTEETVSSITLEDIISYKRKIFAVENLSLIISGKIDDNMIKMIEDMLGTMELSSGKNLISKQYFTKEKNKMFVKLSDYDWSYVDVQLAFKVDNRMSSYGLVLLNSILGGGTTAKLQNVLREELALTSDIYSYIESYEAGNTIRVSYTTHKSNVYNSLKCIVTELNNLKKEITDEDMDTNLPYFTENLWYWLDDSEVFNTEMGWIIFNDNTCFTVEEVITKYSLVTKDSLKALAKKFFKSENASVLISGSVESIHEKDICDILRGLDC